MKKCKKIAALVIMFLLATTLNVYAAEVTTDITLMPSVTEVKVGDTITVTLSANCETGIEGIDSTLEYDKTKLSLASEVASTGFTSMSGEDTLTGEYKLSVLNTSTGEALTEAEFTTLTFEVLDTVTVGETLTVKLSGIELGDSNDDWLEVADKEITFTVVSEGAGDEGAGDEGAGNEGTGNEGAGNEGAGNEGTGNEGAGNEGAGNEGAGDGTTADKEFNNAGVETYTLIAIVAFLLVAIILNAKCRKYKDIK